jgi:hypothetical protein
LLAVSLAEDGEYAPLDGVTLDSVEPEVGTAFVAV